MPVDVRIESSWKRILEAEFSKPYFDDIKSFLVDEKKKGKTIYPPGSQIFNAFDTTPFEQVKVVILGQDPYHGPKQAMGLCFSVSRSVNPPPSLKNIFKELHQDLGIQIPSHGDLTHWAQQGVFLLNAILTVERSKAGSHRDIGWQQFTNAVIKAISDQKEGVIFLLWGKFAQSKKDLIDQIKHYVLESVHPSPFTGNAFFGNHHFSRTNEILLGQGLSPIDWSLPD